MKYNVPEYSDAEIKIMCLINDLEMKQRCTGISMNGTIKALIEILSAFGGSDDHRPIHRQNH